MYADSEPMRVMNQTSQLEIVKLLVTVKLFLPYVILPYVFVRAQSVSMCFNLDEVLQLG